MIIILVISILIVMLLGWAVARLLRAMRVEASLSPIETETVTLERLPAGLHGLRILYISDIHRRRLESSLPGTVGQMGGADLVLVGGDLREEGVPLADVEHNMLLLKAIAPVYAVYGNHDYDEDIEPLSALLEQMGVTVLVNRYLPLQLPGRPPFKLAGWMTPGCKGTVWMRR